tara:strand:- start:212 stop:382 length:171 start_codon:yes stop_codon:yes gene_type:complete
MSEKGYSVDMQQRIWIIETYQGKVVRLFPEDIRIYNIWSDSIPLNEALTYLKNNRD